MKTYEIIGLKNEKQANRIYGRLADALGEDAKIELDFAHSQIKLPDQIDSYIISLVSSFEQVSIIDSNRMEKVIPLEEEDYGHGHDHHVHEMDAGKNTRRNMLTVFFLNFLFSIAEFIFGTIFKSQALLSDAVHDLGDALSIGLAYFFEKISSRSASSEYTYGYRRFSLLGALVTSVILITGGTVMIITTVPMLVNPTPVNHQGVFWVALAAIAINGFSVWLMSRGKSANEKLLNIHLFEDLFGWILVLFMSIILNYTDWYILDPILSLVIASWILYVTIPEFLRISKIFLQAVPDEIDTDKLHNRIEDIEGVQMLSHFHIWSTDGEQHMMSLTVTTSLPTSERHEQIKQQIREIVVAHNISHITIEILYDPNQLIQKSIICEG